MLEELSASPHTGTLNEMAVSAFPPSTGRGARFLFPAVTHTLWELS